MTITSALVLFAVYWFMGLLIALPIGLKTYGDLGEADNKNPASSPVNANIKLKMYWVTVISFVLWVPSCLILGYELVSIDAVDIFNNYTPPDQ